ncbi:MAG: transcriptional repressor [Spirochaetes bacterium]|nr:transcriptional repressor [Spirochaetota bacterium]MBU1079089.1 transcriptional repressor [Spirochaetota bacterium]
MTRARAAVLETLNGSREPMSAGGVAAAVAGCCDQATVYRALHYLEDEGLAESFVLHCAERGVERFYVGANAPHRHWFHCESCHRFIDLGACRIGGLVSEFERELGLRVSRHTMYLSGKCRDCAARTVP